MEKVQFTTHALVDKLARQLGCDPAQNPAYIAELRNESDKTGERGIGIVLSKIGRRCGGNSHILKDMFDRVQATNPVDVEPIIRIVCKVICDDDGLQDFIESAPTRLPRAAVARPAPTYQPTTAPPVNVDELLVTLGQKVGENDDQAHAAKDRATARDLLGCPDWLGQRSHLTADFPITTEPAPVPTVSIGSLPLEVQDAALTDDFLYLMIGVEGRYIRIIPRAPGDLRSIGNAADFSMDFSVDPSLRDLAKKMLPLAVYYSNVSHFTDGKNLFGDGLVRQAVAAGMRALLKEYLVVVAQLETRYAAGSLSLQTMWFYIQPCLATLEAMSSIAVDVVNRDLKGGALLSLLHDHVIGQLNDATAAEIALHLAQLASVPYFDMLEQWIYRGVVDDSYGEFMVQEDTSINRDKSVKEYNDAYWEKRYTVNNQHVPSFLAAMSDKILHTGKYLNVIRESGRSPQYPDAAAIMYQTRGRAYASVIDNTFAYSSASLLTLLNTDLRLMDQLLSIKSYFCMSKGDFFSHFIDTAHTDLSLHVSAIDPSRITALLELALRDSSASGDPFKDSLKFQLSPKTLVSDLLCIMHVRQDYQGNDQGFVSPESFALGAGDGMGVTDNMTGLEAFAFDYEVKWPVSLVISRSSRKRYELLFRHLFKCRLTERVLTNTWLDDQYYKEIIQLSDASRVAAFALRQRMLNFVQSLQYYSMFEVIEPTWHTMVKELAAASTIDDVLASHDRYLAACLKGCMLTNVSTLKTLSKLLTICDLFGNSKVVAGKGNGTLATAKTFDQNIAKFSEKFNVQMHTLLTTMTTVAATAPEQQMSNMVARLDFNGFYREEVAKYNAATTAAQTRQEEREQPLGDLSASVDHPHAAEAPPAPREV
eukprot:m.215931 g.215931  ORF g.215931 m.215931 type:complete len:877 (+) comp25633_c0_seq1:245-2875(+)